MYKLLILVSLFEHNFNDSFKNILSFLINSLNQMSGTCLKHTIFYKLYVYIVWNNNSFFCWKLLRCMMRINWLFVVEMILQGVRHYQYLLSLSVCHIHQWHEKINNGNSFAEYWKWKALPDKYSVNAIFSAFVYSFSIFLTYLHVCFMMKE